MESSGRIFAIAGLGNPGKKYEATRHNIGFLLIDHVHAAGEAQGRGSTWKERDGASVGDLWIGSKEKVVGMKPQQFMNCSGEPIRRVLQYFRIDPKSLVVIHDEVDLPFGAIRLKCGGGDAGHNGLRSISSALGTRDYFRLRMGVGRPESSEGVSRSGLQNWVLSQFSKAEQSELDRFLDQGMAALEDLSSGGLQYAQNRWHES